MNRAGTSSLCMLAREAAGLVPLADGTAKLLQVALVHVAAVYANAAVGWVQPYGADKHHAPLLLSVHNPSLVLAKRPEERLALGLIGADGTVPYMLTDGEHGQSLMSVTLEQLLRNTLRIGTSTVALIHKSQPRHVVSAHLAVNGQGL